MEHRLSMLMIRGVDGHVEGYCSLELMGIVGVGDGGQTMDASSEGSV